LRYGHRDVSVFAGGDCEPDNRSSTVIGALFVADRWPSTAFRLL